MKKISDKNPIVTVSILISDRPDTVRRCLDSVQPLLAAVPSELILTDTGCGEEVRSIIEEYTDHIIDFTWIKDFSAARNVGLRSAKGAWFLYLDDDEWFDSVDALIEFFLSEESKAYNVAYYTQRNYTSAENDVFGAYFNSLDVAQYSDHRVDRIFRITPEVHFERRIHEAYTGIENGQKKRIDAFVHHYGYVFASEEEHQAKCARNQELLELECEEYPEDMRMRYQLILNAAAMKDLDESIRLAEEAIVDERDSAFWDAIHTHILDCLLRQKKWEELIARGEDFLEKKLLPYDYFGVHQYLIKAYWMEEQYDKICQIAQTSIAFVLDYRSHPGDYDVAQLLREEFWEIDRIHGMFLMILDAALACRDDKVIKTLRGAALADDVMELFTDESCRLALERIVAKRCTDNQARHLFAQLPFGGKRYDYIWEAVLADVVREDEEKATAYARPVVDTREESSRELSEDDNREKGLEKKSIELEFSPEYFEEEERLGFTIEPMMKHAWAAQVVFLQKLDRICRENGIRYYADWGTLLGAVRHQGFIPWDDDIDICMRRNDLLRLLAIVEQRDDLTCADIYNTNGYGIKATRIQNNFELTVRRNRLKDTCGFPFPVGVDVFILDNLPDDDDVRQEYKDILRLVTLSNHYRDAIDDLTLADDMLYENTRLFRRTLARVEELCSMKFSCMYPKQRELCIFLDEVGGAYRNEETPLLTQMDFLCDADYSVEQSVYADVVYLPFEGFEIPSPVGYEEVLTKKYGPDYMTPINRGAGHDYPFYKKWIEIVAEKRGGDVAKLKEELLTDCCDYYKAFLKKKAETFAPNNEGDLVASDSVDDSAIRRAEAEILFELQRICNAHEYTLYGVGASAGNAIATGFYDVSEELTLGMLREEYMEFLRVLPRELSPWFDYQDLYHDGDFEGTSLFVLTDGYKVKSQEYARRFAGCTEIVGLEIVPLDYLYESEAKENVRSLLVHNLLETAAQMPTAGPYSDEVLGIVEEWHNLAGVAIHTENNLRNEFYQAADNASSACKEPTKCLCSFRQKWMGEPCVYQVDAMENAPEVDFGGVKVRVVPAQ